MFAVRGTAIGNPGRKVTGTGVYGAETGVGNGSGKRNCASSRILAAAASTHGFGPDGSPQDSH
eukprot:2115636-Amphidinium_carterae.1